ncbi:MAG: hypothetical protein OJJ21_04145 [Ferrovibrio sp.]|uniref:hypothetical protein n=1 Tax=Ferrovibrio sp. TaxID=1917215 RepID=UPI00261B591D|nr:hypothetical protein [Ferrovibrio sp.]MCW0232768.1 hypothetical protein [Ferrovibrio sp.]
MIAPWYWANWAVVLSSLVAGVLVTVLGRRLSPFWHIVNVVAIALYLCSCLATVLSSVHLEQDVMLAGLQLGIALVILVASSYRLHLFGVMIFVAGSAGMAAFRIAATMAHPLTAYDLGVLMLDVISVGFLIILWPYVHAELRHLGAMAHRYSLLQDRAAGKEGI